MAGRATVPGFPAVSMKWLTTAMMANFRRLSGHAVLGAAYTTLPENLQLALAVSAPLSLAMFGMADDKAEIQLTSDQLAPAYPAGINSARMRKVLATARTLIFSTLWNKMTSGHAWKTELLAVRKTTALLLNANGHAPDLMPATTNTRDNGNAALNEMCSLFRLCLHPVDLRAGAQYLGMILSAHRSILRPDEFSLAMQITYRRGVITLADAQRQTPMNRLAGRTDLDGFVARRVHVLPEGTHMISLFAAFLSDLRTSPLGGMCLSDPGLMNAITRLPNDIARVKATPLSSSMMAGWLNLPNRAPDLQHIAAPVHLLTQAQPWLLEFGRTRPVHGAASLAPSSCGDAWIQLSWATVPSWIPVLPGGRCRSFSGVWGGVRSRVHIATQTPWFRWHERLHHPSGSACG